MGDKKDMKALIAQSFRQLMTTHPFDKITIQLISEGAGIKRSTFYNHFADKYEVLEWICNKELFEGARLLLENHMYYAAIQFIFTTLEKERAFYIKAIRTKGQNSFEDIFCKRCQSVF